MAEHGPRVRLLVRPPPGRGADGRSGPPEPARVGGGARCQPLRADPSIPAGAATALPQAVRRPGGAHPAPAGPPPATLAPEPELGEGGGQRPALAGLGRASL